MIRLHLDEQVHGGIAPALRNHGIDVTTAGDAGYGVGELLHMLLLANACFDQDELRGQVEFL